MSQDYSAVTHLRCGGKYDNDFFRKFYANFTKIGQHFVKVKDECIVAQFFWLTVYY